MLYNFHKLKPLFPIYEANNIIVDSRVINSTFSPTTFRVVMSVINLTYCIRNLLINKATTTKPAEGPENNGVRYNIGGQVVKPLDLMR